MLRFKINSLLAKNKRKKMCVYHLQTVYYEYLLSELTTNGTNIFEWLN